MSSTRKVASSRPRCEESPRPGVANAPGGGPPSRPARKPAAADDREEGGLAAARAGDRAAFDELLASYRPRALASALRVLHQRDDAEDAVQDAFVKVWLQVSRFQGRCSFATWTHRIVVNTSLDLLRRSATRGRLLGCSEQQYDPDERLAEGASEQTPESELGRREIGTLVRLAVAQLPTPQRRAVELYELEDYPCQEVAARLGCPVGTVMSRLFEARARLADTLDAELLGDLAA